MTTKKRTPRRRAVRPALHLPPPEPQVEPAAPAPFVNRVVLDNTVPEGFRYEQVPTKPGVTG